MAKKKNQEETIVDVQEVYTKTEMYVEKNRKPLVIVVAAVAIIFIAFFGYKQLIVKPQLEEASNNIWKAQLYFENDSLDLALNGDGLYMGFEEISETYASLSVGKLANYYCGLIYRNNGEYETALDYFQKADFDDAAVGILAMGNVGDMHVELENYQDGATWLEKAARKASASISDEFSAPFYFYKAGIVNLELENHAKAKEMFSEIVENYEGSTEFAKATKYLATLTNK